MKIAYAVLTFGLSLLSGVQAYPSSPSAVVLPDIPTRSADAFHSIPRAEEKQSSLARLEPVYSVACANLLINSLRPDSSIPWELRLPRILWEITILIVTRIASDDDASASYILLMLCLGMTGLIDIFFWAPFFSLFAAMSQECSGGWFTGQPYKCVPNFLHGYGRVLVCVQCLLGGLVYLGGAIEALHASKKISEKRTQALLREQLFFAEWHRSNNQQINQRKDG